MVLLVKGTSSVAFEACEKRGIISAQYYRKPLWDDTEVVLQVSYSEREKVWAWFNEDLNQSAPYPQGSLLHYSYEGGEGF